MTPYKDEFFDPDDPVWHLYGPEMIYSFHASGKFSVEPQ